MALTISGGKTKRDTTLDDLRDTLQQLPYDYTVEIRTKTGDYQTKDQAGQLLEDDGKTIQLEHYELATPIHLPGDDATPNQHQLPDHLAVYKPGDIGGTIPNPHDDIYLGPIGQWLQTVEPETEASTASLGGGILAGLGARLGRHVTLQVGRILHRPNLLVIQVGYTAAARKGTADNEIMRFLHNIDPQFTAENVASGFGSGEALIERVADIDKNPKTNEIQAGTEDPRLYIMEGEFSKVLHTADRRGSILGDVIRLIYDGRQLANLTKSKKLISTHHCVSMFGGITPDELLALFPTLAATSGTGNRYLWVWSNPNKYLPDGGNDINTEPIIHNMTTRLANSTQTYQRTPTARDWWNDRYQQLRSSQHIPEAVRGLTTRTTDQIQRIALIYAATEKGTTHVDVPHFQAGLAWVTHSTTTVTAVLSGLVRNQDATKILTALRAHPGVPVKQSELHDVFSRNTTGTAINAAIGDLQSVGLAHTWIGETDGGRPPTMVMATTPEKDLLRSLHEKHEKKGPKTSFVDPPQNRSNDQADTKDNEYERSVNREGTQRSLYPNTKEVSPEKLSTPPVEDLPDPW